MLGSRRLRRWGWILLLGPVLPYVIHEARGAAEPACASPRRGSLPDRGTVCRSIDFDGLTRTFRLYVPGPDAPRPLALVFVLHGGGGTGIGMARMTGDAFHGLAERGGAIIVYPDGVDRQWNDGRRDFNTRAHSEDIDDVGFISRLIDRIAEEHALDLDRVYATGISNGGMMSFRLGCGLSQRLAAIAPVVANMPVDLMRDCAPARPVSVLVTNGTEDPLIPFEGGHVVSPRRSRGLVTSADDSLAFWARHNGCWLFAKHPLSRETVLYSVEHVPHAPFAGTGRRDLHWLLIAKQGMGPVEPAPRLLSASKNLLSQLAHRVLTFQIVGGFCR